MADAFIGEIRLFAFNFAPVGWAWCQGQTIPIAQNTALFAVIGTSFGGNGTTLMQLPNLQGAFPVGAGQAPGLSNYMLGQKGGEATHSLTLNEIPRHTHTLMGGASPQSNSPAGRTLAPVAGGSYAYRASGTAASLLPLGFTGNATAQGHENRQPYLAINFCIALQGVFPPRS